MKEGDEFEDIPLDQVSVPPLPSISPALEEASRIDMTEWEEKYKRIMGNGTAYILSIKSWIFYDTDLYESATATAYKTVAIVKGRAERYLHVIKDHDMDTRSIWDKEDGLVSSHEYHRFRPLEGDIVVVDSRLHIGAFFSDRYMLGIQSSGYDADLDVYKLVFCCAPHYFYTCPKDAVLVEDVIVGVLIRQLEDDKCELSIIVYNASVAIPRIYHRYYLERLRQRVCLYEEVVSKWDNYYPLDPKKVENRK